MSIYQTIADLETNGQPAVLCTIVESKGSTPRHEGSKMLVFPDGHIQGSVGGGEIESRVINEALDVLTQRKSKVSHYKLVDPKSGDPGICGGQVEVYMEPIIPKLTIVVVGAGHVGRQVVFLAKWLGFRVIVSDDRAELCSPAFMPGADEFLICSMAEIPSKIKVTPYTYFVITTRGSDVDVAGLPGILETNPGYVGVIGSRRRWETTKKEINKQKDFSSQLERVHSPMGLEIRAETPEEIAVSILAEVMMVANNSNGKSMFER
ncbi:MAG: XdhC family protein [Anaerolineaceae bacterium]